MKIAICDDEKELLKKLEKLVRREFEKLEAEVEVICYESGEAYLEGFAENEFDAVFLDVYLPGINGFEVADRMHQKKCNTYVIFITSNSELVYDCFDYQPFYFIRKELYEIGLPKAIGKLMKVMKQDRIVMFQGKDENYYLQLRDILYFRSDDRSVLIHTNKFDYLVKDRISVIDEDLKLFDFVRVHRKNIVNLRYLSKLDNTMDEVELSDGIRLEMSRYYKNEVNDIRIKYLRSMK